VAAGRCPSSTKDGAAIVVTYAKLHNQVIKPNLSPLFAKYNSKDQVKEDEMGRACSTHGSYWECMKDLVRKPE
jgi:hypothetical protein